MGNIIIVGEEHVDPTAIKAIHEILRGNPNVLLLTEKRPDVMELRKKQAISIRKDQPIDKEVTEQLEFSSKHEGNTALKKMLSDKHVSLDNIRSIDYHPEELLKKEYKKMTEQGEAAIAKVFQQKVEERNEKMASNIANIAGDNQDKDIIVLCGSAHLSEDPRISNVLLSIVSHLKMEEAQELMGQSKIEAIYIQSNSKNEQYNQALPIIIRENEGSQGFKIGDHSWLANKLKSHMTAEQKDRKQSNPSSVSPKQKESTKSWVKSMTERADSRGDQGNDNSR